MIFHNACIRFDGGQFWPEIPYDDKHDPSNDYLLEI